MQDIKTKTLLKMLSLNFAQWKQQTLFDHILCRVVGGKEKKNQKVIICVCYDCLPKGKENIFPGTDIDIENNHRKLTKSSYIIGMLVLTNNMFVNSVQRKCLFSSCIIVNYIHTSWGVFSLLLRILCLANVQYFSKTKCVQ